jgi:hypothetical protein
MRISVKAMAYSLLITSIISQLINAWPNRRILGYGYIDQVKDMMPQICLSVIMGGAVYCVQFIGLNAILTLTIQIIIGALIYLGGSKLLHFDSFEYLIVTVKGLFSRKTQKSEVN